MQTKEILVERVLNLFEPDQKKKYSAEVWDMLQKSYEKSGGFASASSPEELIADTSLWKLVTRHGKITALNLYKDRYGRKSIASGTDGTIQGRRDYRKIKDEDVKLKRSWAEVSGAPEKILNQLGAKQIPSKFAELLTGKEILDHNPDGFHYTRMINGHPHEKMIYGTVNPTPALRQNLLDMGITLNDYEG